MFHTAYNSYEAKLNGRDYIGKHSTEDPYDNYLGTFKDKSFDPDAKIIMAYSKTPEGASWFEINFHNVFNVARDPQFVNRAKQTSTKFDRTGVSNTFEQNQKISEALVGVSNTPEQNQKISEALKGLMVGEKHPGYGKPRSEETKQKIRNKKTGIPHSKEAKKKMSEAHIGIQCGGDNPKSKKVRVVYPDGSVKQFPSVKDASASLEHCANTLSRMCRKGGTFLKGKLKGYTLKYIEDTP
jgi:hypothetical protein